MRFTSSVYSLFLLALAGCSNPASGPVMSASMSTDGNYIVTSHKDRSVVLWNVKDRSGTRIAKNGNIYSAYFIKNSNKFIWQDLEKNVHIQNTDRKTLKTFSLPQHTYGHIMSADLNTYVFSDKDYSISIGDGKNTKTLKAADDGSFSGFGKLLNLDLSNDGTTLLTAGFAWSYPNAEALSIENQKKIGYKELYGPTLWDLAKLRPPAKLPGNAAKTYATFSPDGKNIISVCENGKPLFWDAKSRKLKYWLGEAGLGIWKGKGKGFDNTNGIKLPKDYIDPGHHGGFLSAKYLSSDYFVLIYAYEPFAFLYHKDKQQPIKYFRLGTKPFPAVSDYSRNTAIDTAPDAGILVTGQRDGNGINVYKFDKEKLELEKVWVTH